MTRIDKVVHINSIMTGASSSSLNLDDILQTMGDRSLSPKQRQEKSNPFLDAISETLTSRVINFGGVVLPQEDVIDDEDVVVQIPQSDPSTFIDGQNKARITKLLKSKVGQYEVETRVGVYKNNKFVPGVSATAYSNALEYLKNSNAFEDPIIESSIVTTFEGSDVRKIKIGGNVLYQKKKVEKKIENEVWGIRISKASETEVELSEDPKGKQFTRKRYRHTFKRKIEDGKDDYTYQIDVTLVKSGTRTIYEIEAERIGEMNYGSDFKGMVNTLLKVSQGSANDDTLIDLPEKKGVIAVHNSMFWTLSRKQKKDEYRLTTNYANKPVNLKIPNMLYKSFNPAVTVKLDGERAFLLLREEGCYLLSPPLDVVKIGSGVSDELNNTYIDGELITGYNDDGIVERQFFAFDILFNKGDDVRNELFLKRLQYLVDISPTLEEKFDELYFTKTFHGPRIVLDKVIPELQGDSYNRTTKALHESEFEYHPTDGLIYQSLGPYINDDTYKWKPADKMTIDFLVNNVKSTSDGYRLRLNVSDGSRRVVFNGTKKHPFTGSALSPEPTFEGRPLEGAIVEMKWNFDTNNFEPLRFRDDRSYPNGMRTAQSVWTDIINPIPVETVRGDDLRVMRRYHNNKKKAMLQRHFSRRDVILDIGSGRGGDLNKWVDIGLRKVFVVEPNDTNLAELQRRKSKTNLKQTTVVPINSGAEETDVIAKKIRKDPLNGIVSFFSMTFFPSSEEVYEGFIKTLKLLPKGGKFIGIVMDGEEVQGKLDEAREEIKEGYSAPVYSEKDEPPFTIKQKSEFTDSIYGQTIEIDIPESTSMVRKQTEWLFYFEPFQARLKKEGFTLRQSVLLDGGATSESIGDPAFFKLPSGAKIFSSLNRAFVFERTRAPKETVAYEESEESDEEEVSNVSDDESE